MKLRLKKFIFFIASASAGISLLSTAEYFHWPQNIFVPLSALLGFITWCLLDLIKKPS
ncbi:MAG TPA: hypothetical protein VNZ45_02670 [Bacteroidia bacterium]|nr:hypothetical protein [Bacteroidia bacterium]